MPYTYTSLVFLWLVTLGLFAVSASGVVAGSWLILLLLAALATPALVLRRFKHSATRAPQLDPVRVIAPSRRRSKGVSRAFDPSPLEAVGIDVDLWENEGGAPRRHAGSGV
jgi:hypothetical protein